MTTEQQLRAEIASLTKHLQFVERWVNHHGAKPHMTAQEALSCIQHYPPIAAITKGYADGKVPETPNPYAEIAELRAQLEAVGAGGVSGRLMGARSDQPLWVGEKLLQIARETGLRSYLQGVSANNAKVLLKTYADALFAANYAPLPPTAQPAEPATGRWILTAPDGMVFHDESPLKAAIQGSKYNRQTDPVAAARFEKLIADSAAEGAAEADRCMRDYGTLDCPSCGGSGHIGDVAAATTQPQQSTRVQPMSDDAAKDAARYRWLRAQHWTENTLGVVLRPKDNTKLGCFLPFEELLDTTIDAAINPTGGTTP